MSEDTEMGQLNSATVTLGEAIADYFEAHEEARKSQPIREKPMPEEYTEWTPEMRAAFMEVSKVAQEREDEGEIRASRYGIGPDPELQES